MIDLCYRYVGSHTSGTLSIMIRRARFNITLADISVEFTPNEFGDDTVVGLEGCGLFLRLKCPSC
jgi:hypothetical protein